MNKANKDGRSSFSWQELPENLKMKLLENEKVNQILVWTESEEVTESRDTLCKKLEFHLSGAHSELNLLVILIGRSSAALDLKLRVDHGACDTVARVAVKTIVPGSCKINVEGNIFVPGVAQGTDSLMKVSSLLLSPQAKSRFIPALEIIANEVQVRHAAAISNLDGDALFYLQTRGFTRQEAGRLLVHSFLKDELNKWQRFGGQDFFLLERNLLEQLDSYVL